jgi:molecular chaperone GrpE
MSEGERASARGAEVEVKVVDRRRFRPDGEPVGGDEGDPGRSGAPAPQPAEAPPDIAGEPAHGDPVRADGLEAKLAAQATRIDELSRAYASLVEDNKAFRQRLERERGRVIEAERAGVAQALLEAADDLERALGAVGGAEVKDPAVRNLLEGIRLSLSALHRRIGELGAERIPVAGQPFDPHVAEAVDTVAVADESQDGLVLHEVRSGYRIGERVLRPARVRVGRLTRT